MTKQRLIILSDLHLSALQGSQNSLPVAHDGFHHKIAIRHFIAPLLRRVKSKDVTGEILLPGECHLYPDVKG